MGHNTTESPGSFSFQSRSSSGISQSASSARPSHPTPLDEHGWPNFLKTADRWILRILGIVPPKTLPHGQEVKIGEGRIPGVPDAVVSIFVSAFPARFWRVVIARKDGAVVELQAGTVDLQKLWPTVELIARGMLDVKVLWEQPRTAPLPLVSLGQGSFARDLAGNPSAIDPHSPTQSEISAARAGGAA